MYGSLNPTLSNIDLYFCIAVCLAEDYGFHAYTFCSPSKAITDNNKSDSKYVMTQI